MKIIKTENNSQTQTRHKLNDKLNKEEKFEWQRTLGELRDVVGESFRVLSFYGKFIRGTFSVLRITVRSPPLSEAKIQSLQCGWERSEKI